MSRPRFDPGQMRDQVTINQPATTLNTDGHPAGTTLFATVWAEVRPIGGREALLNKQIGASVTHRIRMRYLTGLTADMTMVWDGKNLDIESIENPDGVRKIHELQAVERDNAS